MAHFAAGRELGMVGTRMRWRLDLPDVAPELPFRGWISLDWTADSIAVSTVPTPQRLGLLVESRGVIIAEESTEQWLPIIGLPMVRLRRPKDWAHLDAAMTALLDGLPG